MNILNALKNDENGFIVSAELVLVGTICVLGMIVGLSELSFNVNQELEDVGSAVGNINRANGQEITWSGAGANSTVFIFGFSFDGANKAGAGFYCYERGGAGRFTIPASILLALPRNTAAPGAGGDLVPTGQIGVGVATDPTRFTAPNLDFGLFLHTALNFKGVNYQ